jgi:hypothetical protein
MNCRQMLLYALDHGDYPIDDDIYSFYSDTYSDARGIDKPCGCIKNYYEISNQ